MPYGLTQGQVPENFGQFLGSEVSNRVEPYVANQRQMQYHMGMLQTQLTERQAIANAAQQYRMAHLDEMSRHNAVDEAHSAAQLQLQSVQDLKQHDPTTAMEVWTRAQRDPNWATQTGIHPADLQPGGMIYDHAFKDSPTKPQKNYAGQLSGEFNKQVGDYSKRKAAATKYQYIPNPNTPDVPGQTPNGTFGYPSFTEPPPDPENLWNSSNLGSYLPEMGLNPDSVHQAYQGMIYKNNTRSQGTPPMMGGGAPSIGTAPPSDWPGSSGEWEDYKAKKGIQ